MLLTKEQVHNANDLRHEIVDVPEWGGEVKIRAMPTSDRIEFEKKQATCKTELESIVNLLIYTIVDDDDKRIFNDGDFDLLAEKSAIVLVRLFEIAINLNTLTNAKMEEKAKN